MARQPESHGKGYVEIAFVGWTTKAALTLVSAEGRRTGTVFLVPFLYTLTSSVCVAGEASGRADSAVRSQTQRLWTQRWRATFYRADQRSPAGSWCSPRSPPCSPGRPLLKPKAKPGTDSFVGRCSGLSKFQAPNLDAWMCVSLFSVCIEVQDEYIATGSLAIVRL